MNLDDYTKTDSAAQNLSTTISIADEPFVASSQSGPCQSDSNAGASGNGIAGSEDADKMPPLLHNRKAPQYERQQEQAWHRTALEKAAKGYTAKEIAEQLGCSATTVQDILRQRQYQQTQVDIIRRNATEDDKVYETVKENVHRAVQTLASIMEDRECSPAYRIAAAKELLDRRYGKPNQPVNRNTDVDLSKLTDADLIKLMQAN